MAEALPASVPADHAQTVGEDFHVPPVAPPVRTERVRVSGIDVDVRISGEGAPLLLLSGIFGELPLWRPLLPYLEGFQSIAFDPPGVGRTKAPAAPMSMVGLANFTIGVLDALGIESAHVLGASFGGALAQQLAVSHRGRVERLVLVSTSFGGFALPCSPRAFLHFIHPSAYSPQRLAKTAGSMFGGRLRSHPQIAESLHFSRPSGVRNTLFRAFPLWLWTSLPWLHSIRHPTLVIGGDDDPVTPLINHRLMAKLIPHGVLHVVRGGGHMVLVDSPEIVAPKIVQFLHAHDR
jgi:pimeloyl-ACP methyl ester carboxylesterase